MSQVGALIKTLELQESAQLERKGYFALFNCLVLGHTKYKGPGVQRVYRNTFPTKMFYGSHRMDHVMIRSLGINNAAFVVSPGSVCYACVLLLFSASAMKMVIIFIIAIVVFILIMRIIAIIAIIIYGFVVGWLEPVGSRAIRA
jgi:hypothetical protein